MYLLPHEHTKIADRVGRSTHRPALLKVFEILSCINKTAKPDMALHAYNIVFLAISQPIDY